MSGFSPSGSGGNAPRDGGNIPDDISLTSTMESQHDSEHEFEVEEIHAEDADPADPKSSRYLIEWTGYLMDRWTWEPAHHVGNTALDEWKEKKARHASGEQEPFDVARFNEAVEVAETAKFQRHQRRNLRRQREGLPLVFYPGETEGDYYEIVEDSDEEMPDLPPPKPAKRQNSLDASGGSSKSLGKLPASSPKMSNATKTKSQIDLSLPSKPPAPAPAKAKPTTMTGYQGTARRSSMTLPGKPRPVVKAVETKKKDATTVSSQKAKKSNVKPPVRSTNVFIGGKPLRTRVNLGTAMVNASKQPKTFSSMRILNKASKYSREKADLAPPDPHLLGLQTLGTISDEAAKSRQDGSDTIMSPSDVDPPQAVGTATDNGPMGSTSRPKRDSLSIEGQTQPPVKKSALRKAGDATSLDGQDQPPTKKPRSVRFTGDEPAASKPLVTTRVLEDVEMVDEPEIIVIDDDDDEEDEGLFVGDLPIPTPSFHKEASLRPPTPPLPSLGPDTRDRPLVVHNPQKETSTALQHQPQGVNVAVVFGPSGSQSVDVIFESIPSETSPWQVKLSHSSTVCFTHTCTAYALQTRLSHALETPLACGNLLSRSTCGNLDAAAEQMRLGPFAVVYHAQGFTIIVYPAKCDEWKSIMPVSESTSFESSAALKYVVFNAGKAGMFLPTPTVPPQRTQDTESVSTDFIRQVYGLDYGQLLPDKLRGNPNCHNFFLAFPPSRASVLQMMCTWLRSVNPKCRLFVSDIPGDWTAFVDAAESEGGVFIIHSRALQTIRFFAGIQALLHAKSSHVLFWKFEERFEHLKSRTMSRQSVEGFAPFGLSCIFPHDDAVFLTPSFFVSHPNEAYHLLSWYKAQYRRSAAHIQLVVSSGNVTFLRDLAMEKMAERTHLIATDPRCNPASCALTEKDCKARFDVWQLVSDLTRVTNAASMPSTVFEYADEIIHPCDEQSLVNWFAFWSTTKLHRYRNFRVIGATDSASRRTSIRIDVPPFMRDMSAYPDHTRLPRAAMPTTRSHETDLLERDGAVDFIRHLEVPNLHNSIVRTFKYPVSYLQSPPDMARYFGDLDMKFSTATSWLKWVRDYKGKANTNLCFFYTIKEDWNTWDKDSRRYGTFPPRHAWFAALRPTHPHRLPYEDLELFIWDVATYEMVPAQHDEVYESELLPAQKALIELVRDAGLAGAPSGLNLPLRTVWVGDDQPNWLGNTSAIDRTLKMMELMAEQFKTWLPPSSLALQQHGYRKVVQGSREPPAQPDSSAPLYAVFLPPSAPGPYPPPDIRKPEKHLSVNNFYQKVKKAPAGASKMEYQYTATTSWYGIQRGMGRHFEHIQVGGQIQRIYEALGVPRNADT